MSKILIQKYLQQIVFTASALYVIISMFTGAGMGTLFAYWLCAVLAIAVFISAYNHRLLAHRSWNCPLWLEKILAFGSAYFGLVQGTAWVATHRKHHKFTDTEKDPHGPVRGPWTTFWMAFYDCDIRYAGKQLLRNPLYIWQTKYYWHILFFGIATSFLYDPLLWAMINGWGWLSQVFVSWFGHYKGKATTWNYLNLIFEGELYHEHHHKNPNDPVFGKYDLPAVLIRIVDRNVT